MIRVNLLATSSAETKKRSLLPMPQRGAALGVAMLLLTAAGVGGWWWELSRETADLDTRIAKAEVDLSQLKNAAKLVDRAVARKAELSEKLALIDRLRSAQRGPVNLLSTVSRSLTEGLWLMEIKQQGSAVQMEGRASTLTAVTDFVEHLQNSGIFDRPVEIMTTSMETLDEYSVVRFAIKAQAAGTSAKEAAAAPSAQPKKGD
jgi:type IV pilus assembly protein PilN